MFFNLGYSLREALRHFRRNWSTALGAVVTIFLSLFIIGLFVIGSALVDSTINHIEDQVTIQAFLSDNATQDQVNALRQKVAGWQNVKEVTYRSKEEALEEYTSRMANKNARAAIEALDGKNPMPASILIRLDQPQQVADAADKLIADSDFRAVSDDPDDPARSVQYGQDTVERLFTFTSYIRIIAIVLVSLLIFVAFVFINNTIRLAIAARRREIAIQRLVGASNGFIRGPFIMEAILEAMLGALLAMGTLQLLIMRELPQVSQGLSFLSFDLDPAIILKAYAALLVIGVVIGLFGSAIAMRRYLKV